MSRRIAWPLVLLSLAAYSYFYQGGGWNQNSRFDLTRALVEQGTARIDAYHRNTGDKAKKDGHFYSDKAPGVSLLGALPYAVAHRFVPEAGISPEFLATSAYFSTVVAVGLPAALAVAALALALTALGLGRRPAALFAVAYGLGTLAWPYATLFHGHQLAASLLGIGVSALVVTRHRGGGALGLLVAGATLGFAVVVDYTAFLGVAGALVYTALWLRPLHRAVFLLAPLGLWAAVLIGYHWLVFGGPFTLPYDFSTQSNRGQGLWMGLVGPSAPALFHLLISPYRGLLYSAPWLALAVPGAVHWWRRGVRAEVVLCACLCVGFAWLGASLVDWQGGSAMGARYLIPSIPFWALLAAGVGIATRGRRAWLAGAGLLAAYAFAMMLVVVAVKPQTPGNLTHPFSQYLLPHFFRGELATSHQSIDSPFDDAFLPQAWNLGERLGLDGLAELVPLLALLGAGLVWLILAIRAEEGARARRPGGPDPARPLRGPSP